MLDQDFQEFRKAETRKWVGDLPDGWRLVRNQGLFDETKTIGHADEELLSVTIERGIIPQTEITTKKDSSNEDKSKYKLLEPGDLAYNKMRMWQGAIGRSDHRGIVSPAYVVLRPRDPEYSRYFHYLYRTHRFITEANRNSYGLCDDMNSLRYEDFKTIHTPVPPKDTMYRIVSFLDEKTAEIDAAIAKKRRLIDLLNEQKAILINRAVTKGLNPDAPMKDSGVDWIGEIPAHWDVKRVKYLARLESGYAFKSELFDPNGVPVIRIGDVSDPVDVDGCVRTREKVEGQAFVADDGDILIALSGATTGKMGIYRSPQTAYVNQRVAKIRPENEWLFHLLNVDFIEEQIQLIAAGSAQPNISNSSIGDLFVPVAPDSEIPDLMKHILRIKSEIKNAQISQEHGIAALNEFKQTLIANAVTGKIKI